MPSKSARAIAGCVLADAVADCLYAPRVQKRERYRAMVKAVAPNPVNLLMFGPDEAG